MSHVQPKPPPDSLWGVPPVDPNLRRQDVPAITGQNALVYAMLKAGPVTISDAIGKGVTRLAARIHDLRAAGVAIRDDWQQGTRVKVYRLDTQLPK